jgi:hypothetical protein
MPAVIKVRAIPIYILPLDEAIAALEISNQIYQIAKDQSMGNWAAEGLYEPKAKSWESQNWESYNLLVEGFNKHYDHTWQEAIRSVLVGAGFTGQFPLQPDEIYKTYADNARRMDGNNPIKV